MALSSLWLPFLLNHLQVSLLDVRAFVNSPYSARAYLATLPSNMPAIVPRSFHRHLRCPYEGCLRRFKNERGRTHHVNKVHSSNKEAHPPDDGPLSSDSDDSSNREHTLQSRGNSITSSSPPASPLRAPSPLFYPSPTTTPPPSPPPEHRGRGIYHPYLTGTYFTN